MRSQRYAFAAQACRLLAGAATTLVIGAYGPLLHADTLAAESPAPHADAHAAAAADARRLAPGAAAPADPSPSRALSRGALNPQPLPPKQGKAAPGDSAIKAKANNGALNPQPLPPKYAAPGAAQMLNPQPLPPKQGTPDWGAPSINNRALNPQPVAPDSQLAAQPGAAAR